MGYTGGILTFSGGRVVNADGLVVAPADNCCANCCLGSQHYQVVISGVTLASGAIPQSPSGFGGACSYFVISGTINGTYCLTQAGAGSNVYSGSVPITIAYTCDGGGTLTTSVPITLTVEPIEAFTYDGSGNVAIGGSYGSALAPFSPSGVSFAFFLGVSGASTFCNPPGDGSLPCPSNTLLNLYTSTSSPGDPTLGCPWADGCCNSAAVIAAGYGGQMVVSAVCSC
jgi:hypothetical protein